MAGFRSKIRRRISQRDIQPVSVKTRILGSDIITTKPNDLLGSTTSTSFTFANGEQAVITFTISTTDGSKLLANLDVTFYVGTVTAANALPGGSGIDETQFQMIGPWTDWASTDNKNVKTKVYILNISAGSVTVNVRSLYRYIANNPLATLTAA